MFVTARLAFDGAGREPVEGALRVTTLGGGVFRVPWLVTFAPSRQPLLGDVQISETSFKPSDSAPAVVSLTAGRVSGDELRPVARLDLELWRGRAGSACSSACATCFPAATPSASQAETRPARSSSPGRYRLILRAFPTDETPPSERSLVFRIR